MESPVGAQQVAGWRKPQPNRRQIPALLRGGRWPAGKRRKRRYVPTITGNAVYRQLLVTSRTPPASRCKEAYRICKTAESIRHELRGNYTHLEAANALMGGSRIQRWRWRLLERPSGKVSIMRWAYIAEVLLRTNTSGQQQPSAQAVQRAESWFADNGYQLSLRRKAAVLSDVPQAWSTSPLVADNVRDATALFASVKARGTAKRRSQDYTGDHDIRYEDFMRRIIPQARRMKLFVPAVARVPGGVH